MAEVDRTQQDMQILKNLRPDEFSFSIFDEPFTGTNPIEGAAAEYSILASLADYTNSLAIVNNTLSPGDTLERKSCL